MISVKSPNKLNRMYYVIISGDYKNTKLKIYVGKHKLKVVEIVRLEQFSVAFSEV